MHLRIGKVSFAFALLVGCLFALAASTSAFGGAAFGSPDSSPQNSKATVAMQQIDAQMNAAPKSAKSETRPPTAHSATTLAPYPTEMTKDQGYSWPGSPILITNEFFTNTEGHNFAVLSGWSPDKNLGGVFVVHDPMTSSSESKLVTADTAMTPLKIVRVVTQDTLELVDGAGGSYRLNFHTGILTHVP